MVASQLPFGTWREEKQVSVLRRVMKGWYCSAPLQTEARCQCRREGALVLLCDLRELWSSRIGSSNVFTALLCACRCAWKLGGQTRDGGDIAGEFVTALCFSYFALQK